MMKREKSEYIIQTVSHALTLLGQFNDDVEEYGLSELSKRLNLRKNNVFRLLATLESHNFVEQDRVTGNYRLGIRNLELGQAIIRQMGFVRMSRQILEQLSEQCNETCYLAAMKDIHVIYLDVVESEQPVRVVPRVGTRIPAHSTAAGKVHLAYIGDDKLTKYLSPREFKRFTSNSIMDVKALKRELQQIRNQGYAVDDEETDEGVRCVSAPIRDYASRVVGAVSISGPVTRFSPERMERELIPLVKNGAEEISARLGYRVERALQ